MVKKPRVQQQGQEQQDQEHQGQEWVHRGWEQHLLQVLLLGQRGNG